MATLQSASRPRTFIESLESRIAPAAVVNINLSSLDGTSGFTLNGVVGPDDAGSSVSPAGDVNGDGFDDLFIGAPGADAGGTRRGESYVVFGQASGFAAPFELSALDGTNGFRLFGAMDSDRVGTAMSGAGDINGDGFDDLLIGVRTGFGNEIDAGESYVIYGKANFSATNGSLNLSTIDGTAGFKLSGIFGSNYSGSAVSAAGDVNGDGFDDLLIGAPDADPHGQESGESYVVFGKPGAFAARFNLATLDGTNGFKLSGIAFQDYSGSKVSAAGDVNGDGFDDLLVGAMDADPNGAASGATYVVFGKADFSGNLNLSTLNGTNGFKVSGAVGNDHSGSALSAAGDVNGDGFDDFLVGAPNAAPHGANSGASYLVFGKADFSATAGNLNLADLNGTNGVKLSGGAAGDKSGTAVSGAGDVNGDGFDDLLVGAPDASPNGDYSGAGYVVFGRTDFSTTAGNLELSALDGTDGFKLSGIKERDHAGCAVSIVGDINGDGFDDLLIGARGADPHFDYSGASYLVFGFDTGGGGGKTLTGDGNPDILIGGTGIDTLTGAGGADVIRGGQGNDILAVSDFAFKSIRGGTGLDTLRLDGTGLALNLKTLANNRLTGIEQIDLTGNGNNALQLSLHEVLALSDSSNTLLVQRDLGDVVSRGPGWVAAAAETIGLKTYDVFTQGAATLKIQQVAAPVNAKTFDATHPFVFHDLDNDLVTVKLSGKGSVIAVLNGDVPDGADLASLALTDTDTKSKLTITVKKSGAGLAPIGAVSVNGALAAFTAAASDLGTGITTTGLVKAITLRDLLGGEIAVGGAATDLLAITAHAIAGGTDITTTSALKSITVKAGGAGGTWSGAAFKAIAVTGGALSADITSAGAIAKITVKGGGLTGDLRAASFGPVSVTGGNFSGSLTSLTPAATLGKIAALKSLTINDGDLTGDVRVLGIAGVLSVKGKKTGPGGNAIGASIVAGQIGSLTVAKNFTSSVVLAGADLGADYALGGGDDSFVPGGGTIGTVKIGANVSGMSVIGAGLKSADGTFKDMEDVILGGAASVVKSFTIGGTADLDSYFAAGLFKATPKIGGDKVDLATNTRFKVG